MHGCNLCVHHLRASQTHIFQPSILGDPNERACVFPSYEFDERGHNSMQVHIFISHSIQAETRGGNTCERRVELQLYHDTDEAYLETDCFHYSCPHTSSPVNQWNDFLFFDANTIQCSCSMERISIISEPGLTYLQRATIFLDSIDISFNTKIFATIGYPFIYLFNEISNINIDLSAIKISCSGSQAPNFLLLNCIIVGLTIFIIESDANIFWMTLLKKISSKFGSLLFNRYYLFHSFCSTLSIYSLVSYLLLLLPTPMKIIQVSLGYVSLSKFFEQGGRSSSSLNCDGAISIPLDSLLAVATTILAIVILAPIIFLFGQVLVPSFKLEKEAYDQTLEVLNNAINAELSDDFNLYWATHKVSSFWRVVSALSSIDWFYLKAIFNFALRLYDRLKIFGNQFKREFDRVETNHLTDEYSEKINKIVEDEINVDRSMPILPWFYASFYINNENENFISMEKIEWRELKEQFPSFFTMVRAIQSERRKGFLSRCGHYSKGAQAAYLHFIRTSSWVPIFQWFDSAVGLQYWKRVAVNYCVFLTISLGVWTHYVTRAFCVIDKYENFFPKDSDDEDDSKLIRNYERKNQFIEYFSAYANARTVLLQLIPGGIFIVRIHIRTHLHTHTSGGVYVSTQL